MVVVSQLDETYGSAPFVFNRGDRLFIQLSEHPYAFDGNSPGFIGIKRLFECFFFSNSFNSLGDNLTDMRIYNIIDIFLLDINKGVADNEFFLPAGGVFQRLCLVISQIDGLLLEGF